MSNNAIQVSGRVGDAIVVIGGDTPETFLANCAVILGDGNEIQNLFALALDAGALEMAQAKRNLIDGGLGNASAAPTPVVGSAVPAPPAPGNGEEKSETDKFGRTFIYGIPGAPQCPHGARVQMKATSKTGKPYTAYVCPTHTPSAFRQKIQKDASCAMEFAK